MFDYIKETWEDFIAFLRKPVDAADPIQTGKQKAKKLFSLLVISLPIMGICLAIVSIIGRLGLVNTENHKLTAFVEKSPVWLIVLTIIVIVPFVEELAFRLYLKYKNNDLVNFITSLVSLARRQSKIRVEMEISTFWTVNFKGIFYFSSILFGLLHIRNYDYSINVILLTPILISPQIIAGLFLGYLRIKYNLALSYFMHSIHNAISLILFVFL